MIQVLHLSNGNTINNKLAAKEGRVAKLLADNLPPEKLVELAYRECLSRPPSDAEMKSFTEILNQAGDAKSKRETVEDLYWSLLTSREFLFQH